MATTEKRTEDFVKVQKESGKSGWARRSTANGGRQESWWDGRAKSGGRSACGIVMKGVDEGRWVTVSEIAVPAVLWR